MGRTVHPPPLARKRIAAPSGQVLSLAQVRDALKITTEWPDDLLLDYLAAAAEAAEREVELAFLNQQWAVALDAWWYGDLELPYPKLVSVDKIEYRDSADALQTLAGSTYEFSDWYRPGRVRLATGKSWPAAYPRPEAIQITFTCGHGATSADLPPGIRHAVRQLLAHNERNLEPIAHGTAPVEVPLGVRWLLSKFRIPEAA